MRLILGVSFASLCCRVDRWEKAAVVENADDASDGPLSVSTGSLPLVKIPFHAGDITVAQRRQDWHSKQSCYLHT